MYIHLVGQVSYYFLKLGNFLVYEFPQFIGLFLLLLQYCLNSLPFLVWCFQSLLQFGHLFLISLLYLLDLFKSDRFLLVFCESAWISELMERLRFFFHTLSRVSLNKWKIIDLLQFIKRRFTSITLPLLSLLYSGQLALVVLQLFLQIRILRL